MSQNPTLPPRPVIEPLATITTDSTGLLCYEPYYYGADLVLEKAFEKLENSASGTITSILNTKKLPPSTSEEYLVLLFYILSQDNRTKRAGEQNDEVTNKIARIILQGDKELSAALQHWKIVGKIPTAVPLSIVSETWFLAFDLEMKIICNLSQEGFITCDSPVVYYNQYMEKIEGIGCTGLLSQGLQIFFPISPQTMLLLYDSTVYRVGSNKSDCCEVYDDAEVIKLNELQWLNALENIYYSNKTSPDSIQTQAKRFLPHRPTDLAIVEEYGHPTEIGCSLVTMQKSDFRIRLRPSFVQIKKAKARIPLNKRNLIRNEHIYMAWNQFKEQVKAGNYQRQDFLKFLAGRPKTTIMR